jgi:hypothetical protein
LTEWFSCVILVKIAISPQRLAVSQKKGTDHDKDDFVKSRNSVGFVIPAKAGIQLFQGVLDPGFRRGDASKDFLRDYQERGFADS